MRKRGGGLGNNATILAIELAETASLLGHNEASVELKLRRRGIIISYLSQIANRDYILHKCKCYGGNSTIRGNIILFHLVVISHFRLYSHYKFINCGEASTRRSD